MILEKLHLHHFRNYDNELVEFSPNLTLLVGKNGQGKTNLLEAIFFLVFGRSFRSERMKDVISWGETQMHVQALIRYEHEKRSRKIDVGCTINGHLLEKTMSIDEVPVKHFDYLGTYNAVLFLPDDLNMIDLEPSLRRRFMDITLSQVDPQYAYQLTKYGKILKIRNKLLQQIQTRKSTLEELIFWDEALAEYGTAIMEKRKYFVGSLNERTSELYSSVAEKIHDLQCRYEESFKPKENMKEEFLKNLREKTSGDLLRGHTSIGPHRDDLSFYINKRDARGSASRGEYRTLVLVLKMLELDFIEEKTKKRPIFLLDDISSELDEARRKSLFQLLGKQQSIITSTDKELMKAIHSKEKKMYTVEEGKVIVNFDKKG